jgi:TonB-linked SusC/RagA family outer membrane protein
MKGNDHGKGKIYALPWKFFCRGQWRYLLIPALLFCVHAAKSQTITLNLKEAPVEKAFSAIQAQTTYRFIYTKELVEGLPLITLMLKNASFKEALDLLFKQVPLGYTLSDSYILVKKTAFLPPQERMISGTVRGDKELPLSGASVMVKGTPVAISTDEKGEFTLKGVKEDATIQVSNVGYQPQEIELKGRNRITVQLRIAYSALDETVVIAYGTTTKRLNTGSISKISSTEIKSQPVSSPLAALSGRITGLFISQNNGMPGSNFSVQIRGQNSIQSGNSPLYIIDGIPFLGNTDRLAQRSLINASNPFNSINPEDIESIEVLKDADATAIYGSRGANGVILITTKKGSPGKTSLELNLYEGWGKVTRNMDYLPTSDYIRMRKEAFQNDAVTPTLANAPDLMAWDTTRYTDLKKLLVGGTAHYSSAYARLAGGNMNTNFTLSSGYHRETTVFPGDLAARRTTVDAGLSHRSLDQKLSINFSAGYASEMSDLSSTDITSFINLPPNLPALYDSLGRLNWSENGALFSNPLAFLCQSFKTVSDRLTAQAQLSYKLTAGLYLKTNLGYNQIGFSETSLTPIASQNPANNPKGSASFGFNQYKTWNIEPQLQYRPTLGEKGSLEILLGSSFQKTTRQSLLEAGSGYTSDNLLKSISGAASVQSTNDFSDYRYNAAFARVNYSYKRTYLLNLTSRRDGSSRFGPGRRFANFGAVGAAWIFSEDKQVKKHIPFISFGKLRASYGLTGNDQINNYQYLDNWLTTQYPYQGASSLRPSRLFNPDYGWEQTRKLDVALELGFFRDRIFISANWFENRSGNQIINYQLPTQTGFKSVLRNFPGLVENKGVEAEVHTLNVKTRNLAWSSSFTLTSSKNKLLEFPGLASSSYASSYAIGEPLNVGIGYRFLGVDTDSGFYRFEDLNKDGKINSSDYQVLSSPNPVFYGGFQNTLQYKNWQLDLFFSFVKQLGTDPVYYSFIPVGLQFNQPTLVLNHWQKPGDVAPYQQYTQKPGTTAFKAANSYLPFSDAVLSDASFIRLKNLSLSYKLSEKLLKKLKLDNLRFYLEGQNLLTLTSFKGADPESQNIQTLPPLRVLAAGLQITF